MKRFSDVPGLNLVRKDVLEKLVQTTELDIEHYKLKSRLMGAKILVARRLAFLSQIQLAYVVGTSNVSVSRWERGESVPDCIQLLKISEVTKKDISFFFNDLT